MTVDEVVLDVYRQLNEAGEGRYFWVIGEDWLKAMTVRWFPSRIAPLSHGLLVGLDYTVVEGAGKPRLLPYDEEKPGPSNIEKVELILDTYTRGNAAQRANIARQIVEALA